MMMMTTPRIEFGSCARDPKAGLDPSGAPSADGARRSTRTARPESCAPPPPLHSTRRRRCFGVLSLRHYWRGPAHLVILLLAQQLADSLRLTERTADVPVRRPVDKEQHALAARALSGISIPDPARLVPEFQFAARAAHLNGFFDLHRTSLRTPNDTVRNPALRLIRRRPAEAACHRGEFRRSFRGLSLEPFT